MKLCNSLFDYFVLVGPDPALIKDGLVPDSTVLLAALNGQNEIIHESFGECKPGFTFTKSSTRQKRSSIANNRRSSVAAQALNSSETSNSFQENMGLFNNLHRFCFPKGYPEKSPSRLKDVFYYVIFSDISMNRKFVVFVISYVEAPTKDGYFAHAWVFISSIPCFVTMKSLLFNYMKYKTFDINSDNWTTQLKQSLVPYFAINLSYFPLVIEFTSTHQSQQLPPILPSDNLCLDVPIFLFLYTFDQETLSQLMTAILLDQKVVFMSKAQSNFAPMIMAALYMILPLEYFNPCISMLTDVNYLDSPTPAMYGCLAEMREEILSINDLIILDLDTNKIERTTRSNPSEETPCTLPQHLKTTLHRWQDLYKASLLQRCCGVANLGSTTKFNPHYWMSLEAVRLFQHFMATLLHAAPECLDRTNEIFNTAKFVAQNGNDPFYRAFAKTQVFRSFVDTFGESPERFDYLWKLRNKHPSFGAPKNLIACKYDIGSFGNQNMLSIDGISQLAFTTLSDILLLPASQDDTIKPERRLRNAFFGIEQSPKKLKINPELRDVQQAAILRTRAEQQLLWGRCIQNRNLVADAIEDLVEIQKIDLRYCPGVFLAEARKLLTASTPENSPATRHSVWLPKFLTATSPGQTFNTSPILPLARSNSLVVIDDTINLDPMDYVDAIKQGVSFSSFSKLVSRAGLCRSPSTIRRLFSVLVDHDESGDPFKEYIPVDTIVSFHQSSIDLASDSRIMLYESECFQPHEVVIRTSNQIRTSLGLGYVVITETDIYFCGNSSNHSYLQSFRSRNRVTETRVCSLEGAMSIAFNEHDHTITVVHFEQTSSEADLSVSMDDIDGNSFAADSHNASPAHKRTPSGNLNLRRKNAARGDQEVSVRPLSFSFTISSDLYTAYRVYKVVKELWAGYRIMRDHKCRQLIPVVREGARVLDLVLYHFSSQRTSSPDRFYNCVKRLAVHTARVERLTVDPITHQALLVKLSPWYADFCLAWVTSCDLMNCQDGGRTSYLVAGLTDGHISVVELTWTEPTNVSDDREEVVKRHPPLKAFKIVDYALISPSCAITCLRAVKASTQSVTVVWCGNARGDVFLTRDPCDLEQRQAVFVSSGQSARSVLHIAHLVSALSVICVFSDGQLVRFNAVNAKSTGERNVVQDFDEFTQAATDGGKSSAAICGAASSKHFVSLICPRKPGVVHIFNAGMDLVMFLDLPFSVPLSSLSHVLTCWSAQSHLLVIACYHSENKVWTKVFVSSDKYLATHNSRIRLIECVPVDRDKPLYEVTSALCDSSGHLWLGQRSGKVVVYELEADSSKGWLVHPRKLRGHANTVTALLCPSTPHGEVIVSVARTADYPLIALWRTNTPPQPAADDSGVLCLGEDLPDFTPSCFAKT